MSAPGGDAVFEGEQAPTAAGKAASEELKAKANAAFGEKSFDKAVQLFTAAIAADGTNHILFSNRSGAHLALGSAAAAAADARRCVALAPEWSKGYSRLGAAAAAAKDWPAAISAYALAVAKEPTNASQKLLFASTALLPAPLLPSIALFVHGVPDPESGKPDVELIAPGAGFVRDSMGWPRVLII